MWEVGSELIKFLTTIVGILSLPTPEIAVRVILAVAGAILMYLGYKRYLEPLIMIPMGLGMVVANLAFIPGAGPGSGNPHVDYNFTDWSAIWYYWLQPFYTLMFSNGLIACLVFFGIGSLTDITFLMARPYVSFILAAFAELGTIVTLPIATAFFGFTPRQAASIALIGGADGPIVLFASTKLLNLPKELNLFVAINVVGYLYLSILYMFQEKLDELTIPKKLLAAPMDAGALPKISPKEKIVFSVVIAAILSALFPTASPLLLSFFLGVIVREARVNRYIRLLDEVILDFSTFILALVLGTLITPQTLFNVLVLKVLVLGIIALTLSSIGGSIGGIIAYYVSKGKINPLLGPAGVSCVPTTAKISHKVAIKYNPRNYLITFAMGPNVAGVVTTAILASIYMALFT